MNLRWEDQVGKAQQSEGLLVNISSSGASVRALRPLRIGTRLSLGYQNQELMGKVKHCAAQRRKGGLGLGGAALRPVADPGGVLLGGLDRQGGHDSQNPRSRLLRARIDKAVAV